VWSSAILAELEYHEEHKLIRWEIDQAAARTRAAALIAAMRTAFEEAETPGWEPLEGSFGLPDPDDEHVVASAAVAGADVIVTSNLRHFLPDVLPASMAVQAPAAFAARVASADPAAALRAIEQIAARTGRYGPRRTVADFLDVLDERYGFTDAVTVLRQIARDGS
jgi:hypothetical protein